MRSMMLMVLVTAATSAASADAQVLGAPALPEESARELSFGFTQPDAASPPKSRPGVAASYRRTGRVNLSARLAVMPDRADAEVGTFGALPLPAVGGIHAGWRAGLGFNGVGEGLYVPVGIDLSRPFQVRSARVTPFAHGRVSLVQIDPPEREIGQLAMATEVGVDVGTSTRWSLRASVGSTGGEGHLLLGFAFRR